MITDSVWELFGYKSGDRLDQKSSLVSRKAQEWIDTHIFL